MKDYLLIMYVFATSGNYQFRFPCDAKGKDLTTTGFTCKQAIAEANARHSHEDYSIQFDVIEVVKEVSVSKSQALKLAHAIKTGFSSFSSALKTAYAILKDATGATLHKVRNAMQRAYSLLEQLNDSVQADKIFKAFLVLVGIS